MNVPIKLNTSPGTRPARNNNHPTGDQGRYAIEAKNLNFYYGDFLAVKDVNVNG